MTDACMRRRNGKPCGRLAQLRGICTACYQNVCHQIKAGKTTWTKEVAAGRALEPVCSGWNRSHGARK